MSVRGWIRDLVLVALAVTVGWWMRGAGKPVFAQAAATENLAFQMLGTGPDSTLVMYNRGTRSLYVYARAGAGSSTVNCTYSFLVSAPGAPLLRTNCPVGEMK